jgi:hypothetical protein
LSTATPLWDESTTRCINWAMVNTVGASGRVRRAARPIRKPTTAPTSSTPADRAINPDTLTAAW